MELSDRMRRAAKMLAKSERACKAWDFRSFDQCRSTLDAAMRELAAAWEAQVSQADAELQGKRSSLDLEPYRHELEGAMRAVAIPFDGSFPSYTIGPFTLQVSLGEGFVSLRFGRRAERTGAFEPATVARWVAGRYDRLIKRPLNQRRFYKDLVTAYQVGNRLAYHGGKGQVLWGKPVALEQLYQLLTLRNEVRKDYPRDHFVYDLARLRQGGLTYGQHSFEFGFSRDQGRAFLVPNLVAGGEERFSSLTVHERKE